MGSCLPCGCCNKNAYLDYNKNADLDYNKNVIKNNTSTKNKYKINKNREYEYVIFAEINETMFKTYNNYCANYINFTSNFVNKLTQYPQLSNNVYLYENRICKIVYNNNTEIYRTIYNNKIKNILLPKLIYRNKHKNVYLEFYDYYKDGDIFNLVVENTLSIEQKINIFTQILEIIKNLHNIGLTHRDIKLENFVYYKENNKIIPILIDLEYVDLYYQNTHFRGGTLMYIAPEYFTEYRSNKNYKSIDIWALGILLYTLIFSAPPWYSADHIKSTEYFIYHNYFIQNKIDEYFTLYIDNINISNEISTKIKYILKYSLNLDFKNRSDINQIINVFN